MRRIEGCYYKFVTINVCINQTLLVMTSGPGLFEWWITLSTRKITIQWIAWFVLLTLIHWISIVSGGQSYPAFEQPGLANDYMVYSTH